MSEVSGMKNMTRELDSFFALCRVKIWWEISRLQPRRGLLLEPDHASILISDL